MKKYPIYPETLSLYALVGLLLLTLWGLILAYGHFQSQQEIEVRQKELSYLRSAVAQHSESLFRSIESDLHHIDLWLQAHPNIDPLRDANFLALVDGIRRDSGGLVDPRMVSTQGRLHYIPAHSNQALADVGDRPYYQAALRLGPGKLYIADPVLSRVTGKWGIPVSMQLTRAVGGMQVVFAAIELDRLQAIHESYRIPSGSILLLRTDGVLLSRTPFDAQVIGRDVSQLTWFAQMRDQRMGDIMADGRLTDGQARYFSFQSLQGYPLVVAVSRGVDETLGVVRQRQQRIMGVALLLSLGVLFFTWRLMLAQRQSRALRQALQHAVAQQTAAQNASPLGLFRIDAAGRLVEANAMWRQIHGLPDDAPLVNWWQRLEASGAVAPASDAPAGYLSEGEHSLRLSDGRLRRIMVKFAAIMEEGVVQGYSGTVEDVTERRASQQAQRMLSDALDLSTDIVVQVDVQGHYLYVNAALRRFGGFAHDVPLSAIRVQDIVDEKLRVFRQNVMLPAALHQGFWQGETLLNNAQGEARTFSHLLIAHRAADGTVAYFTGMLRDITLQKQGEQQALENQRRLRAITDNAPCLIAEIDEDYIYRFANRAYQDWLGIAPGSMVGRSVEQVFGSELFQVLGPQHAAALRGERVSYERETLRNGEPLWLRVVLVPRLGENGRANGCFGIGFDITEIRQAQEALRQSEQRMRSIADRLPMRLSFVDVEQRYRFLNLAYERAFTLKREALYGCTVREVVGEAAYARVEPHVLSALKGKTISFESEITTAEGYRCYRADYIPQFAASGRQVTGFVALITDTTSQKMEERRLLDLSQRDPLTGQLNRAGFDQRLRDALQRVQTAHGSLALLYLDLDHFKQVNDSLGHLVGDLLLQGFAGRLLKALRATDTVARLGGDEFAIVLEDLDSPLSVVRVAENIVAAMRESFLLEDRTVQISTSIGVAVYDGKGVVTSRELMRRADEQLYAAKAAGRNRFQVEPLAGLS